MCQKKPGLRCRTHAMERREEAIRRVEEAASQTPVDPALILRRNEEYQKANFEYALAAPEHADESLPWNKVSQVRAARKETHSELERQESAQRQYEQERYQDHLEEVGTRIEMKNGRLTEESKQALQEMAEETKKVQQRRKRDADNLTQQAEDIANEGVVPDLDIMRAIAYNRAMEKHDELASDTISDLIPLLDKVEVSRKATMDAPVEQNLEDVLTPDSICYVRGSLKGDGRGLVRQSVVLAGEGQSVTIQGDSWVLGSVVAGGAKVDGSGVVDSAVSGFARVEGTSQVNKSSVLRSATVKDSSKVDHSEVTDNSLVDRSTVERSTVSGTTELHESNVLNSQVRGGRFVNATIVDSNIVLDDPNRTHDGIKVVDAEVTSDDDLWSHGRVSMFRTQNGVYCWLNGGKRRVSDLRDGDIEASIPEHALPDFYRAKEVMERRVEQFAASFE